MIFMNYYRALVTGLIMTSPFTKNLRNEMYQHYNLSMSDVCSIAFEDQILDFVPLCNYHKELQKKHHCPYVHYHFGSDDGVDAGVTNCIRVFNNEYL